MSADYLIVGQGIAGSVLAWTLHQRGKKVVLVNAPQRPSASLVAAGIFNPLTGRKLVRTWKADELFPFLTVFYGEIEKKLNTHFLHFTNIYRPYRSVEEQNTYMALTADPSIYQYIAEPVDNQQYAPYVQNPYGGLEVTGSGWVDVPVFLHAIQEFFRQSDQYIEADFNHNELVISRDNVVWRGQAYGKLLFCEGPHAKDNPLFDWLPYNPVKGQVLDVVMDNYHVTHIVNQGIFIMPVESNLYRVGATYTWHDLDWQTTEDGKAFLEQKLQAVLKVPYRIIGQRAGIRPATKDRRPLMGLHPAHPAIGIFNGLGTKGVSLAPFWADRFADFLEDHKELDPEVNIERTFSLYYSGKNPV
ncbi:glycine/D-amino acid oxidase-like deaminating enzyme [Larkinella arboricola]|uniref:Glycine/D-amino acid oxidase-like deaminating enzyme n=1 Tax=Larkinella arboricola TaxID=643671 RepID=A0A327WTT6_LARAB|nr:FAD-dependent oxidoreductase [Larkinella arboricola]RAJ95913.1 glycine/D-amino acid oxidase-like deaminating enzyme [Larkinella arboricola]